MKNCNEIKNLIQLLQAGGINAHDKVILIQHIEECEDCRILYKTHMLLDESAVEIPSPAENEFSSMRATVLQKIRVKNKKSIFGHLSDFFDNLRFYVMKPEFAVALFTLVIGFLVGRTMPPEEKNITNTIVKKISKLASGNKQLSDVQNSPYIYSNINFKEFDDKNISLDFDVSTHIGMVRPKNDPLVKEVLAQALLTPTTLGTRLKAISYSEGISDKKIKETLIFTMHNAPDMAVRLKAMNTLKKYHDDKMVQEAFLIILKKEESVQMRLMALDYLDEINFNKDRLRAVLADAKNLDNSAILIRAGNLLKEKQ